MLRYCFQDLPSSRTRLKHSVTWNRTPRSPRNLPLTLKKQLFNYLRASTTKTWLLRSRAMKFRDLFNTTHVTSRFTSKSRLVSWECSWSLSRRRFPKFMWRYSSKWMMESLYSSRTASPILEASSSMRGPADHLTWRHRLSTSLPSLSATTPSAQSLRTPTPPNFSRRARLCESSDHSHLTSIHISSLSQFVQAISL